MSIRTRWRRRVERRGTDSRAVAMIKIKHFMDGPEQDDGTRIWVEPMGLTRDLREMCDVHLVFAHLGPPRELWEWFEQHPTGYEFFRGRYHEHLAGSGIKPALQHLADLSRHEDFTLLHQGVDPECNTAMALYEFLAELAAHSRPDL